MREDNTKMYEKMYEPKLSPEGKLLKTDVKKDMT